MYRARHVIHVDMSRQLGACVSCACHVIRVDMSYECHVYHRYAECVSYFCVRPKSGERDVSPEQFFGLWSSFCHEFREVWKQQQKHSGKER